MDVPPFVWLAFAALIVALLAVDLFLLAPRGRQPSFRRAVSWSVAWTALGLAFAVPLAVWGGRTAAEEYLGGFLIEKSLSVDNLFVFALVFSYFAVPAAHQARVLFWGIVGAIVLRGLFIAAGASLLDAFHYTIYVFGVFLVVTGVRMARHSGVSIDPERNPALRLLRRALPMSSRYEGDRFFVRERGRLVATPMVAALALVAAFDVVFAVDSIPAIFAITRDVFVVAAANAFSLLGLRALYLVLAGMLDRFVYLHVGLGAILVFVGAKMTLADVVKIPVWLSLVVIVLALAAAVVVSVRSSRSSPSPTSARPSTSTGTAPEPSVGGHG